MQEVNLIHEAKLVEEPDHVEENAVSGSAKNQEASTQTDAEGGETSQVLRHQKRTQSTY